MTTSNQSPDKDMNIVLPTLKDIIAAVVQAAEAGSLEEVLERINRVAQELVNARYAALGVPDGQGGLRYFKTAGMTPEEIDRMPHPPEGHGLLGAIMNERTVLRLSHMQEDERSSGFPEHHPHMENLLGVPIQVGQQLFGMLYLADRRDGQPFSEQDEWLVETLAGYAALAIASVQLSEQQNRLVLLEERERVAMELHDGTIQSLYAIGMQLQLMRLDDTITTEEVGKAINELDTVIEDIRGYILDLKVANYQTQTIREALYDIIVRLRARDCVNVVVHAPDELPVFAPPVFEAVCQIAREALSNVMRHARADTVTIHADQRRDVFELTIADNGRGFDMNDPDLTYGGMGLRNIRQRARNHEGLLDIDSSPDHGTRVTLRIPLHRG